MSITRPDLFDLRGHFMAPQMLEGASLRPGHSITFFEKVFPLSDTLAVLITPSATLLVDVAQREIYWIVFCFAQTAALDRVHHLLALGAAGEVTLWNLQTGALMHRIELAEDKPVEILFAPDGSWLAVALFEHGVQI